MTRVIALFAALLSASCVGLPDRVEVETGVGGGDIVDPRSQSWDDDTSWVAVTLSFPITYDKPWREWDAEKPPPMPEVSPAPAPERERPWWEDITAVQGLVILLTGGAAAVGARPGLRKCREIAQRRKEKRGG